MQHFGLDVDKRYLLVLSTLFLCSSRDGVTLTDEGSRTMTEDDPQALDLDLRS